MQPKPKKHLGQNFLVDPRIRNKIILSCNLKQTDTILEIGAGRGELTLELSRRVKCVYAVELDKALCNLLEGKIKISHINNVRVINTDILKFDLSRLAKKEKDPLLVIGNIPYYLSSPLLEYLFAYKKYIREIYLTLQKEFSQRLVAQPKSSSYSGFSCFVQYQSHPQILFYIKKTCFLPAPRVDSAFVRFIPKESNLADEEEKMLFLLLRTAFQQRRKTIKNSLSGILDEEVLARFFTQQGLPLQARPQELSLDDFILLTHLAQENIKNP